MNARIKEMHLLISSSPGLPDSIFFSSLTRTAMSQSAMSRAHQRLC